MSEELRRIAREQLEAQRLARQQQQYRERMRQLQEEAKNNTYNYYKGKRGK